LGEWLEMNSYRPGIVDDNDMKGELCVCVSMGAQYANTRLVVLECRGKRVGWCAFFFLVHSVRCFRKERCQAVFPLLVD